MPQPCWASWSHLGSTLHGLEFPVLTQVAYQLGDWV